jgi:hypothetical protein
MAPYSRKPENKPLPERWRYKHGAYYYRVPPGAEAHWDGKTEFRLGRTVKEAYKAWSERLNAGPSDIANMSQLMDRYALEIVPTKAIKSQESNQLSLRRLRPVVVPLGNPRATGNFVVDCVTGESVSRC